MFDQPIIPKGMHVQLSRHRIRDGMSDEADRWMRLLNDRRSECLATFARDAMAMEVIFRLKENGDDFLYWFEVRSAESAGDIATVPDDSLTPIDREHVQISKIAKEPGHVDASVQFVLMAPALEAAIREWIAPRS
jgi:hypothetical protein